MLYVLSSEDELTVKGKIFTKQNCNRSDQVYRISEQEMSLNRLKYSQNQFEILFKAC